MNRHAGRITSSSITTNHESEKSYSRFAIVEGYNLVILDVCGSAGAIFAKTPWLVVRHV